MCTNDCWVMILKICLFWTVCACYDYRSMKGADWPFLLDLKTVSFVMDIIRRIGKQNRCLKLYYYNHIKNLRWWSNDLNLSSVYHTISGIKIELNNNETHLINNVKSKCTIYHCRDREGFQLGVEVMIWMLLWILSKERLRLMHLQLQ